MRELLGLVTALWRTQNATGGGCWTAEQNCIGAVTQWTCIWWNLGVIPIQVGCGFKWKVAGSQDAR